jgi:hypothetical protein
MIPQRTPAASNDAAVSSDIRTIVQQARDALDARKRVLDLKTELTDKLAAEAAAIEAARIARADADTQAILAPKAERAKWQAVADAEGDKLTAAQRQHERLTGALAHLPQLLAETDNGILAAEKALNAALLARSAAARKDLADRLRPAVAALVDVLRLGHALEAAGIQVPMLHNLMVRDPNGNQPLVNNNIFWVDGEMVNLSRVWRDDPAAVALFEAEKPYASYTGEIRRLAASIREAHDIAFHAANRAARLRSFEPGFVPRYNAPAPEALVEAEPAPAPAKPAAQPAGPPFPPQDGQVRFDLGLDDPGPMTQAQIDALWDRCGRNFQQAMAIANQVPSDAKREQIREAALQRHWDPAKRDAASQTPAAVPAGDAPAMAQSAS